VGLIPAEIIARADINDPDRQISGGESATERSEIERCSRDAHGGGLEKIAAGKFRC
jgi:hypothetical protein